MNKDKKIIFIIILLCFLFINITTQLSINKGKPVMERMPWGDSVRVRYEEYELPTRLLPIALSFALMILIFLGVSDKDDFWMIWLEKTIPKVAEK